MSDDYADVRSEAEKLRKRFVDLEVEHQALQAYYGGEYDEYAWTDEEKARQYTEYDARFRGEIETWFADLTELFGDMADLPDPDSLRSVATGLEPALRQMAADNAWTDVADGKEYAQHANFVQLDQVATYLVDWNGLAADAFKSTYLPPMPRVLYHQFRAIASLRSSMLAAAEMWDKARKDVSDLIDEANSALDDYDGGKDSADAVMVLSIIGAIVAVAAVPATGGTSAALYWTMAGSALAVTGAVVGNPAEPKKELDIKGDSPAEIYQSLREAVLDMKIQWIEHESFINDQLLTLSDTMSGYVLPEGSTDGPRPRSYPEVAYPTDHRFDQGTANQFVLPRPSLADTTRGDVRDAFGRPEI